MACVYSICLDYFSVLCVCIYVCYVFPGQIWVKNHFYLLEVCTVYDVYYTAIYKCDLFMCIHTV